MTHEQSDPPARQDSTPSLRRNGDIVLGADVDDHVNADDAEVVMQHASCSCT